MSQAQSQRLSRTASRSQIAIVALVVVTALVHLQRGIGMLAGGFGGGPGGRPGGPPGGPPPGGPSGGFNIMQALPLPLPALFLLNGIGYLVLVTALNLPALARYRRVVRWLLIAFAAVTIVMYFLIAGFSPNPIGLIDKAVEIALIVLLLIEDRREARAAAEIA